MATFPIDVRIDPSRAVAGSSQIKSSLRGVQAEGRRTSTLLLSIFGGAALIAGTRRSIGLLADFSQEMSTVRAVSRATESEFSQLQNTAERLGRTTRFSATQAAEGMTFLARAGFDANEVLGTVEGTLQLAQAGGLGLGRAADIASNALQGFGLEVAETGRVVDVLALAANSSNTSVAQLGDALSFAAPIASGLGVSIEETTAAIGALSNAGLQGSRAGTGLNRVLAELESPTDSTRETLDELGVSVDQVRISSVGLTGALSALESSGVTTGQALELFGQRGGPAFDVLSKAIPDIREMNTELDNAAGTAQRVAETMDDNLNGAILASRSALQGFIIEVGNAGVTDGLVGTFGGLADGLRFASQNVDILAAGLFAYTAQVAFTSASQSTLLTTTVASTRAFFAKTAQLRLTTVAMIAANGAARTLGAGLLAFAAANPVLIGIAAVSAAFILLNRSAADATESIQDAQAALSRYNSANASIERDTELLRQKNEELSESFKTLGGAAKDAAALELDSIRQRIRGNEQLRDSYTDVLEANLAAAQANRTSIRDVARAGGIDTVDVGSDPLSDNFGSITERSNEELERAIKTQLDFYREAARSEEGLTQAQSRRFAALSSAVAERARENLAVTELEQSLRRINETGNSEAPDGILSRLLEFGQSAGSNIGANIADAFEQFRQSEIGDVDFNEALAELEGLTAAIGMNEAALMRANGVIQFARDNELELTEAQKQRVESEIRLQQVANDNQAQQQRIRDIEKETELLGVNSREAEVLATIYQAERDSLLGLSGPQEARIRALIEQQQIIQDTAAINERLDALDQEAFLLTKIGTEGRVLNEVLRLQNQLERDLTDTEVGFLRQAIELNDELERRRSVIESVRAPAQEAIRNQQTINDLYRDGALTLGEYNRLLSENGLANDVRNIDNALNINGGNIGPSGFEQERINTEQLLRQQEGGGTDDGSGQTLFGLNANELGAGDENERIREQTQERIDILRLAREQELLTEQEFADRKTAVLQQSINEQRNALLEGLGVQLSSAENLFGSLGDIARRSAGEQSGIYRALFATQQAFAIAQSVVSIQQGLSAELSKGFPAAIPGLIAIAAQGASIIGNIQSVRGNFRDGGIPMPGPGLLGGTGGPREDSNIIRVSRGEGILNAEATRRNLGLFNALNQDPDFLRNAGVFRDGGIPGRSGAAARIPANNNAGRGSRTFQVDVGGIRISMPDGVTSDQARSLGREAGEELVRALIEAETNRPGGIIFERISNG